LGPEACTIWVPLLGKEHKVTNKNGYQVNPWREKINQNKFGVKKGDRKHKHYKVKKNHIINLLIN
jgi:hypothetical protein